MKYLPTGIHHSCLVQCCSTGVHCQNSSTSWEVRGSRRIIPFRERYNMWHRKLKFSAKHNTPALLLDNIQPKIEHDGEQTYYKGSSQAKSNRHNFSQLKKLTGKNSWCKSWHNIETTKAIVYEWFAPPSCQGLEFKSHTRGICLDFSILDSFPSHALTHGVGRNHS